MDIEVRAATERDIGLLENLYDNANDYLAATTNYPGWKKGVYPTRQDAEDGIKEGTLFIATINNDVAASMVLRHKQEEAYNLATWQKTVDNHDVWVIYTFVVKPKYLRHGIGRKMLAFAAQYAFDTNAKALRLDVYEKNLPAIKLYESCGYQYIDTVSLGLEKHGLDWFRLYEKLL